VRWPPTWELISGVNGLMSELEGCCDSVLVSSCCEKQAAEAPETVRETRERGTSAVRSRHQATTGEDNSRLRRLRTCCSELQIV
jgi:hypothetical protein